ncbi:MAG: NUDIX hydrolase [Acidobacteria bacterium]|nr:NUDIX hydrolase [Acidobacteriota bacterium]MCB9396688.1 NUDIX hydrolase [Acidobacteriota bacterium]
MDFERPIVSVDVALFTLEPFALLLQQRAQPPFEKVWALPGGFIHTDEDENAQAAVRRILLQKTGAEIPYMEQLFTFSGRARDPRGWSVSIAHYALIPRAQLHINPDTTRLVPIESCPQLPFDHNQIVETALTRLRNKSAYSSLPTFFLGEDFSLSELQDVYEQVLGIELDRTTFRRNLLEQGLIEPTGQQRKDGAHRPAQLYRRKPDLVQLNRTL